MRLKCIRTNSVTGKETIEEHRAMLGYSETVGWCVRLLPGVTGYESFILKDYFGVWDKGEGWMACAGTANSWDKLFVPQDEMDRLRDILELLPIG